MSEIKHALYENGISEIFRLIVTKGNYQGEYDIVKPDGWDELDSTIDINEDYFNVDNFIIGNSVKLKFLQYNDQVGYQILKNVFEEQAGDGQILFKWILNGEQPLGDNFEINLNKYKDGFEKSMLRIETELKKRESQSKLLNREDITINLFDEKNIDSNVIEPVETFEIAYKKGDSMLSNFWFFSAGQNNVAFNDRIKHMFLFAKSEQSEFGNNANTFAGFNNIIALPYNNEQFLYTAVTLKDVKLEFSNFKWGVDLYPGGGFVAVGLIIIIKNGVNEVRQYSVADSVPEPTTNGGIIQILNKTVAIGSLNPGESVFVEMRSASAAEFRSIALTTDASVEITTNLTSPMVKTRGVRLFNAIDQVIKNYTDGKLSLQSSILNVGGDFFNSSISTGAFLRGLPSVYTISDKLKTSFSSLFNDGAHPLMALGFDVLNEKVLIENVDFFFKNVKTSDLSMKSYLEENYNLEHDGDFTFNTLVFGSKKFSTQRKNDINNFNTKLEATTPIITIKNKFEKQTEFIIDEYKIQELVEDKSLSTNTNDDDLVLIDLVTVNNFWDSAVFQDCQHYAEAGYLWLSCTANPFDVTLIEVGNSVQITEGLNIGNWIVLEIVGFKMKLNKTSGIQNGVIDTPLKYLIANAIKNRTTEGFNTNQIANAATATNIRHNPKYNLARWFAFFASGLRKKPGSDFIKVTNYKNNAEAEVEILDLSMANELPGVVITGADETLSRLRSYKRSYFNGKAIEITLVDVEFSEFLNIFNNWRYGLNGDLATSRGYITVPTPDGIVEVFPFGSRGFEHDKRRNELTIRGKARGYSAPDPLLLSVVQNSINNISLIWDYEDAYTNPEIKIKASLDGVNWSTIAVVNNIKSHTLTTDYFVNVLSGTTVYFEIVINTTEFYNKNSNSASVLWKYNDFSVKEVSSTSDNCFSIEKTYLLSGSGEFEIIMELIQNFSGGSVRLENVTDGATLCEFSSVADGSMYTEIKSSTLNLNSNIKELKMFIDFTDFDGQHNLSCTAGNNLVLLRDTINLEINDSISGISKVFNFSERAIKRYIKNNLPPDLDYNLD